MLAFSLCQARQSRPWGAALRFSLSHHDPPRGFMSLVEVEEDNTAFSHAKTFHYLSAVLTQRSVSPAVRSRAPARPAGGARRAPRHQPVLAAATTSAADNS